MPAELPRPEPSLPEPPRPDRPAHGAVPRTTPGRVLRASGHPAVLVLAVAGVVAMLTDTRWVDGLVAVVVAAALVRDGARTGADAQAPASGAVAAVRRRVAAAPPWLGAVGCGLLAVVLAPFPRYSVEATVTVWALGAAVAVLTWPAPAAAPGAVPRRGVLVWGGWAVAACVWELVALAGQPSPTEGSWASPTLSVLLDPALATAPGRAVGLAGWLLAGWWLCRRVCRGAS